MEQTLHLGRTGWSREETEMLWKEIREAADTGAPLRGVFERMGQALGRKPNSVRNYYYMQLRDRAGEACRRAAPFETFSEEEIHELLRQVLMARGRGQSVRACVTALSQGDRALMLRYQNKYRALLRKHPERIAQVCGELRAEGLPCPEQLPEKTAEAAERTAQATFQQSADPDVQAILAGLASLARRAGRNDAEECDRLKVQRDLLTMKLEDAQVAAKNLARRCKDFLGLAAGARAEQAEAFCDGLAELVAQVEKTGD